ncbi:MAG: SMI1/KNR4 family protein [Proteobacteria bacterium]|nr:SMI1/KNR4 family protein [Pseudomonadota bacterium]MCL2308534.1 SMI1/KNR4 family protein [Pseudomonadota bacterium]
MKKRLTFKRKTVSAMIAGALLMAVSTLNMAQGIPENPSLIQTLGKDQIEETVQVSLGLTEQLAGEIRVDYLYSSTEMTLSDVYRPQKYGLRGYARMKPGKRVKAEGHGILLAQNYLTEVVSRPTALGGFLAVWQGVMRDITRADPESFPVYQVSWQIPGLVNSEDIAAAERRLGVPLPAMYRETMRRSGPWRVSLFNGFSFELLAPWQLISVGDWLQRHYGPAEWEPPENQLRRQQLKQDVVFAIVNNEPWVFRYSGAPCDGDSPSFTVGQTASEGFYINEISACGANEQLEAIRRQMLEALNRALLAPEFTIVGNDQRLHIERNKLPEKKTLQLYLKAAM